jgi:hypothetical protein
LDVNQFCKRNEEKCELSLCLNNYVSHHADVWGSGDIASPFLASALDGGQQAASCTSCFTPGERDPGTHWRGGWVGLTADLDIME